MSSTTTIARRPGLPGAALRRRRSRLGRATTPYALLLPAAALYAIFIVYPIYRQFDISFYDWHIFPGAANPGVGFSNFTAIFKDPAMGTAAINTLLFVVITVPVQIILGLGAAAIVTDRLPARGLLRGLIFIPVITSWVVVAYVFAYIFAPQGGLANAVIGFFAGHPVRTDWLAQRWTGEAVIWIVSIWKGIGWSFIMFLAALDGVPRTLLEAARVDGAREPRVWRHVIIPSIRPTLAFVLVLLLIGASQVWIQVFLLTQGGPYGSTQVLLGVAYQQAFTFFQFSYGAAIASLMAVVVLVFSIFNIRMLRGRAVQ
ncbi:MAG TPA: sugar ABC transporter permease [Solirubrobacteraceae bacterium]|nr:sugar ABC transporter permease [Solirubrobacteraceae bacterium]